MIKSNRAVDDQADAGRLRLVFLAGLAHQARLGTVNSAKSACSAFKYDGSHHRYGH